jgi:hypothetical protein
MFVAIAYKASFETRYILTRALKGSFHLFSVHVARAPMNQLENAGRDKHPNIAY